MMDLRYVAGGISVTTSNGNESAFNRDEATIIIGDFLPTPVTHPDTNRAWRRVTTLIETTALPLSQIGNQWIIHVSYFTSCFNKRCFNPLDSKGNYSAPPNSLLAVSNVTAHPSTASVPITVLLYDGPLFCGFNVATKGLTASSATSEAWFIRMYSRWQKKTTVSQTKFLRFCYCWCQLLDNMNYTIVVLGTANPAPRQHGEFNEFYSESFITIIGVNFYKAARLEPPIFSNSYRLSGFWPPQFFCHMQRLLWSCLLCSTIKWLQMIFMPIRPPVSFESSNGSCKL